MIDEDKRKKRNCICLVIRIEAKAGDWLAVEEGGVAGAEC